MTKFVIINPDMTIFEELVAISHNLRMHTKVVEKAPTVYRKQYERGEMIYWQKRMDEWIEKNAKEILD